MNMSDMSCRREENVKRGGLAFFAAKSRMYLIGKLEYETTIAATRFAPRHRGVLCLSVWERWVRSACGGLARHSRAESLFRAGISSALALAPDGERLFVACATSSEIAVCDLASGKIDWKIVVPATPLGLALSREGTRLYVACAAPRSVLCVVDVPARKIIEQIPLGHTAMAPVLSPEGTTLYVCNRFDNEVSVIDLRSNSEIHRWKVQREPVAASISPDGKLLVVANHLHNSAANNIRAGAVVSLIDTVSGQVKDVGLSDGASLLRGVAVSPDGRFAAVTHLRAMYWLTTTSVEFGRMNCNALSFLDLTKREYLGTILLDHTARGAANPWAVAWSADGKTVMVAHAGTHELSLVDAPINADPANFVSLRLRAYENPTAPIPSFPKHPVRLRHRVPLPGHGPRALVMAGSKVYVANYFSDDISILDLSDSEAAPERIDLGPSVEATLVRKGEMWFNDARLCFQNWQSCASCHDADGRADGLNWDLLNDGPGNPKNTKSLVQSHTTAPAMALGVRASAEAAVRAGIRHILFTNVTDDISTAIDAWLKSLRPEAAPCTVTGASPAAIERGRKLFLSGATGCAECHPPPAYTDLLAYDVGTACIYDGMWDPAGADKPNQKFDTPALVELWRTGPYLHDGSAATLREVLTTKNVRDQHGATSHLTDAEIEDLIAYLVSL